MVRYLDIKTLKRFKGKTCLLRVDFNVEKGEEDRSFRIKSVLPTIKLLLRNNIKVIILSHRGRFGGRGIYKAESLKPFTKILSRCLRRFVVFIPGFSFPTMKKRIENSEKNIFLLENIRFNKEEEANNVAFAKKLATLADFYVNDAFAVSHRKNASVVAITSFLPSFAGLLMKKEIENLNKVMKRHKKPLVLVIGGVKVPTKTDVMKYFWKKAERFLLGGGLAITFMAAKGLSIGNSAYDKESICKVKKLLQSKKVILPLDFKVKKGSILDIGDVTAKVYAEEIRRAKTVIWSGPMGYFEKKEFAGGSEKIARAIAKSKAFSVVGGGETTSLLVRMKLIDKFSFVSTGGGAMLDYLAGKKMPGIVALERNIKN